MSRIRFATARAVFEAFPEESRKIGAQAADQSPIDFLKSLMLRAELDDAVRFCALLLPRREAVWWACGCARSLLGKVPPDKAEPLLAAEAWVQQPETERREAALRIGTHGDSDDPLTWIALAAGWAGGMLFSHPERPIPMPPFMTARAARLAVQLGAGAVDRNERPARLRACVAEGIRLADAGL